jgi:hypothetical protein
MSDLTPLANTLRAMCNDAWHLSAELREANTSPGLSAIEHSHLIEARQAVDIAFGLLTSVATNVAHRTPTRTVHLT